MNELGLEVNFHINNPQIKAESAQAKAEISGIADTAESASKRISDNLGNAIKPQSSGMIADLKSKIAEAKKVAESATNELSIELANAKIQQYEKQLQRLAVIGKQGFDDMGNKIADEIEKPVGKLQRLQKVAEMYANMAATSNNQQTIEKYNRKLQETQLLITQTQNVGKVGFDKMGNAVQNSGSLVSKLWSGLYKVANILPGLGVAGILAFALDPLIAYLSKLDIFKTKLTETQATADAFAASLSSGGEYASAIANIEGLKDKIALAKTGHYDGKAAIDEYNKSIGAVAGQVKTLDEAEQGIAKNADHFIQMTLYKAAALETLKKMGEKQALIAQENAKTDVESLNYLEKFGKWVAEKTENLPIAKSSINWHDLAQARKNKAIKLIQDEIPALDKVANELMAKASEEAKKMGGTLGLDKSKPIATKSEAYIQAAESLQRRVYEIQQEYTRKRMSKDDEELQAVRDKFAKLAEEVKKFNKNQKNKIKVDGSSLDATRDKAIEDLTFKQNTEKLKIELERQKGLYAENEAYKKDFGEKAANERYGKELATNKSYIDLVQSEYEKLSTKQAETLTGGEKERLDYLTKALDIAKKERQKTDDEQYKQALEAAQTYTDKLVNIEKDYQNKLKALKDNGGLTSERMKVLEDEKNRSIESAKDEALQKLSIYKKLNEDVIQLTSKQIKTQIEVIRELLKISNIPTELRAKLETQLQSLSGKVSIGVDQSYLNDLENRYKDLVKLIGSTDSLGNSLLSEAERKRLVSSLIEIKTKIKEIDKNGDGQITAYDKLAKRFDYLKGSSKELAEGLNRDLQITVGIFDQLGSAVSQFDADIGNGIKTIGQMVNALGKAAEAKQQIKDGNLLEGITSAVGAANFVFGVFGELAKAAKSVDDFYANAIKGERAYQDLLKQRALDNIKANQTNYNGILSEFELRKQQLADYQKEFKAIMADLQDKSYVLEQYVSKILFIPTGTYKIYDTLAGKSFEQLQQLLMQGKLEGEVKTLVERLVELEQKGYDTQKAMAQLAQQMAEIFTGTTVDGLADSLLEMFKAGKTGVQDLADFFQETMQNAALSIFKNKILAEAMDKFYQEFSKATMDGGLDQAKIANLKLLFDSLVQGANTQFNALQQVTGLNLVTGAGTTGSSNTLTGQIQRNITEATGSELAGLARSYYDISKKNYGIGVDSLAVIKQNATYLLAIQNNTAKTVDKLEDVVTELKTVSKNTKSTNSAYDNGW